MLENENDGVYPERREPEKDANIPPKPDESSEVKRKQKKPAAEIKARDGLTPTEEGRVQRYTQMVGNYYDSRRKSPDDSRLPMVSRMVAVHKRELRGKPELNQARIADTRPIIVKERRRRIRERNALWDLWNRS